MLQYKGYSGQVTIDEENGLLRGQVIGIKDVVTFQAASVVELQRAFRDSVDDYLDFCKERGEEPDKPFSGKFVLRVAPQLHRQLSELAAEQGQSLNRWVTACLESVAAPTTRFEVKSRKVAKARKVSSH